MQLEWMPIHHISTTNWVLIMIGELDKNGITKLDAIVPERTPSTWKISENGNKINVDAPNNVRYTFTRKWDSEPRWKKCLESNDKKGGMPLNGKPPFYCDYHSISKVNKRWFWQPNG